MTHIPKRIIVCTGDGRDRTDGAYTLHGTVNNLPFWRKAEDRWLYSSPKGLWTITDKTEHFATGWGYVVSGRHNGLMPHEVKRWKGTAGDGWQPLANMMVTEAAAVATYSVPVITDIPSSAPASTPARAIGASIEQAIAEEEAAEARREEEESEALYLAEQERREAMRGGGGGGGGGRGGGGVGAMKETLQEKNESLSVLKDALNAERTRSATASAINAPLVQQSQHWRKAAQELVQVKIHMEAELQEVRELASQRVREKDRVISSLEEESSKVRHIVSELSNELTRIRSEVKEARASEQQKEDRLARLERSYAKAKRSLDHHDALMRQQQQSEAEMSEARIQSCMAAVEEQIWGDHSTTHIHNNYEEERSADVAAHHSYAASTAPPSVFPHGADVESLLCADFCYELDNDLPSGGSTSADSTKRDNRHRKRSTLTPSNSRGALVAEPDWPRVSEDAVVNSLAQIIRGNRLG